MTDNIADTHLYTPHDWYDFRYSSITDTFGHIPVPVGTYHCVRYTSFWPCADVNEKYGPEHKIVMIYSMNKQSELRIESTYKEYFESEKFLNKINRLHFTACPTGKHVIQCGTTKNNDGAYSYKQKQNETQLYVTVLGFKVISKNHDYPPMLCPNGLEQARTELARRYTWFRNSRNPEGLIAGIDHPVNNTYDIIDNGRVGNIHAPWNLDTFDTGVCTCMEQDNIIFNPTNLLWAHKD